MRYRLTLLLYSLLLTLTTQAQELTVKDMKATNDLSASQYRRADLNGETCALVKVQLATADVGFEGNVIQPVEYKGGEYWVYMTKGSRELRVKHLAKSPAFVPYHVSFSAYGIKGLESVVTYNLTLLLPQSPSTVQTQKLTINYSPSNAMVLIDSKPYKGNGRVEAILPIGNHNYIIAAEGYESAEGSVKLTAASPRTVTEELVSSTQLNQQISPVVQGTETKPKEDQKAAEVSIAKENETKAKTIKGYRVQAFAGGNSRKDRLEAESIGNKIKSNYPEVPVYVQFYSPRWICRIGNYRTYDEAHQMQLCLQEMGFTNALIVKGRITVNE